METTPGTSKELFVDELRQWPGCRSIWIAPAGELWHTEPDLELERAGYRLLDTLETRDTRALEALRVQIANLAGPKVPEPGRPSPQTDLTPGEHARSAEARVGV